MVFQGWPAEALEFYEGLEADNSKSYWTAHKSFYEAHVRDPMVALLTELSPEFGEGKLFRPNRDIRFSSDKSPYKTAMGATVAQGGYIQLSSQGLATGNGMYMMAPDQLQRYRQAVADDDSGADLEERIAAVEAGGIEVSGREVLKTAPKGYAKDHPRIELLRFKGLVTWKQWPVAPWLGTAGAKKRVVEFFRASRPIGDWLDANIGPSALRG